MKVCFDTFGCRLNRAESLEMEAQFLSKGWQTTNYHSDADLIIVRGCSVTERAQRDCEKHIAALKAKYPAKRIFRLGCLKEKTPEEMLRRVLDVDFPKDGYSPDAPVPLSTARAYLKVQDGCSCNCSFCIVPSFRGKSVSYGFDSLIARAEKFLAAGYSEIVVTGCNLSLYLSGSRRLPELLDALSALSGGAHRVRIGSLEPGAVARDVVGVMAERKNICRFLHIPIQSASNKILAEMRRPYRACDIGELADLAVKSVPGISLGCDVISGFPGETGPDHTATLEFVKQKGFTNAHAFAFSKRPGTAAASLPAQVERSVRSERARQIAEAVTARRKLYAKTFKNKIVEVLVEKSSSCSGWTSEYLWCSLNGTQRKISPFMVNAPNRPKRKSIVKMLVKDVVGDILYGDIV